MRLWLYRNWNLKSGTSKEKTSEVTPDRRDEYVGKQKSRLRSMIKFDEEAEEEGKSEDAMEYVGSKRLGKSVTPL